MAISSDICDKITASIISELESGVMPWVKPWEAGNVPTLPKRHNGAAYRGINILILWQAGLRAGYRSPVWMTFKQALEYKAGVRKGEKGTQIVFASKMVKETIGDSGESELRAFSFLKGYTVFNADQIDNLPAQFAPPAPVLSIVDDGKNWKRFAAQESWFSHIPAKLSHGGGRAFFRPSTDEIVMPPRDAFNTEQHYFSVLAHELTHWSGAESRLNRTMGKRFGDNAYAMEELVAELGAAFAMAEIGLAPQIRDDHAPYIAAWLKCLKADSRAILTAAAKASEALQHLAGYQPGAARTALDEAA
jgi:antirestriction protein ArdC